MRPLSLLAVLLLGTFLACSRPRRPEPVSLRPARTAPQGRPLARVGHAIQAGAFARAENAARFTETLQAAGLEATYFKAADGLHKVRFGDFPTKEAARRRAEALKAQGLLEVYYLVAPEPVSSFEPRDEDSLRRRLSETARSFLGVPYLWGGADPEVGFDCSGLAMTVYRLHGLKLPRASRAQYDLGSPVVRPDLREGDLVFFATAGKGKATHVGVYTGGGRFIHAPSRGKVIEEERLDTAYYALRFLGGRSYLGS